MKTVFFMFFAVLTTVSAAQSAFDKMTNLKMKKILMRESEDVKGGLGSWEVSYREKSLTILTSEEHNRMRIVSPIVKLSEVDAKDRLILLEANFDKALDAKYAVYNEIVWSSFTHPLGELTVEQFKDAMDQVVNLVNNYGTTYSSTHLVFGGGEE